LDLNVVGRLLNCGFGRVAEYSKYGSGSHVQE
jgi:hypothetical protein